MAITPPALADRKARIADYECAGASPSSMLATGFPLFCACSRPC